MANKQDRLLLIICKSTLSEPLTQREQSVFNKWIIKNEHLLNFQITEESIRETIRRKKLARESWSRFEEKYRDELYGGSVNVKMPPAVKKTSLLKRLAPAAKYAAAAMLILSIVMYYFNHNQQPGTKATTITATRRDTIAPRRPVTKLTLANGAVITLDSTGNGILAHQGITTITRLANGQVEYKTDQPAGDTTVYLNTLTTPKGGACRLVLPDGTTAWLNTASSLRYPAAFTGLDRMVVLSGEAYFEVTKNRQKPFIVKLHDSSKVEVFGTKFNISAYDDDQVHTTTLLEGSVKITTTKNSRLLKPGQQATVNTSDNIARVSNADTGQVMAWTTGRFNFKKMDYKDVMKQLERWYDFTTVYDNHVPHSIVGIEFVPRTDRLQDILERLCKVVRIKDSIAGKKVILTD